MPLQNPGAALGPTLPNTSTLKVAQSSQEPGPASTLPRPSSWRRGERTSEPRAGTRSRAGGLGTPREGAGGREGTRRTAGGSLAPRNETHKRQRRPPARRWPPGEARSPGRGQRSGTPGGGVSSSAHTPCPGLGVGFLRRAVGVRRRPGEERDSGKKAGGCAPRELLVEMEPEIPVLYEKVGRWALSLLGTSRLAPSLPAGLHPKPPWVRQSVGSPAP